MAAAPWLNHWLTPQTIFPGQEVAGTKMILVKMPPGTYATKPVPLYGFDMSVDQRELDPPRGLWGMMKNTTADTITWTGADGFVLPTWAIDYLRMYYTIPASINGTIGSGTKSCCNLYIYGRSPTDTERRKLGVKPSLKQCVQALFSIIGRRPLAAK